MFFGCNEPQAPSVHANSKRWHRDSQASELSLAIYWPVSVQKLMATQMCTCMSCEKNSLREKKWISWPGHPFRFRLCFAIVNVSICMPYNPQRPWSVLVTYFRISTCVSHFIFGKYNEPEMVSVAVTGSELPLVWNSMICVGKNIWKRNHAFGWDTIDICRAWWMERSKMNQLGMVIIYNHTIRMLVAGEERGEGDMYNEQRVLCLH